MLSENIIVYFRACAVLGLIPFYNKKTKRFRPIPPIPIVVLSVVFVAQAMDTISTIMEVPHAKIMLVQVVLQPIGDIILITQTAVSLNFTLRDSLQALIDTFDKIDVELQTVHNLKDDQPKSINLIKWFVFSTIGFMFFQTADYVVLGASFTITDIILYHLGDAFCFYILQLNETFKIILVIAIWKRMKVFNSMLSELLLKSNPSKNINKFDSAFLIQCQIGDLIDAFNKTYGWNLLISIVQTLIYVLRFCILLLNIDNISEQIVSLYFVSVWMLYSVVSKK